MGRQVWAGASRALAVGEQHSNVASHRAPDSPQSSRISGDGREGRSAGLLPASVFHNTFSDGQAVGRASAGHLYRLEPNGATARGLVPTVGWPPELVHGAVVPKPRDASSSSPFYGYLRPLAGLAPGHARISNVGCLRCAVPFCCLFSLCSSPAAHRARHLLRCLAVCDIVTAPSRVVNCCPTD